MSEKNITDLSEIENINISEEDLLAARPNPQEYNDKVIWPDKVRLNLLYMERQSLWLDVKVLICTALGKTVKGFE